MIGGKWTFGGLAGAAVVLALTGRATAQPPPAAAARPASAAGPAPAARPAAAAAPADDARPVAVVNGQVITKGELDAVLNLGGPSPLQLPEGQQRQHQMEALGLLIDDLLMHQFLSQKGPPVPAAEVDKKMAEMEAGLRKQNKSLKEFCQDIHKTEAQVRADIAHSIQWANFTRGRVTEADTEQYYKEFRDFFDKVTVRASHIVLRMPPDAPDAERAQARTKLAELRGQILGGKLDFADAAKAHSQCPSAAKGGDLGFFPRKWVFDEPFARAAFALQPGEVSDVVQTDYGLHLIKVTERKPGEPSDYTKIKDVVREFCVEDLHQLLLAEQRKAAKIEIKLP
jgi:peptidyl-prolyl cis-trans isomerase C